MTRLGTQNSFSFQILKTHLKSRDSMEFSVNPLVGENFHIFYFPHCGYQNIFIQMPLPIRILRIRKILRHSTLRDYDVVRNVGDGGTSRTTSGTSGTRRWTTSTTCRRRDDWWRLDQTFGEQSSKFMESTSVFLLY